MPLSREREEGVNYILQYTVQYEYSSREGWGEGRVEEREGQGKGRAGEREGQGKAFMQGEEKGRCSCEYNIFLLLNPSLHKYLQLHM